MPKKIDLTGRNLWLALGNPGPEYEHTYHNAGRLAFDYLLPKAEFEPESRKRFEFARAGGRIYVRPLSYMNESGPAAAAALRHFQASARELLVFQDDSDLPLGSFRISCGSGAAGHHGIESLLASLKTRDFCRVRIGIRPRVPAGVPAEARSRAKAGEFVLRKISAADRKKLQSVFREIEKVIVKEEP